jgi:GNAT superfamily N-acetyltransferase
VLDRWRADLAAETGARRRALDALAFALGFDASLTKELAMPVVIRPVSSSAALVTAFDVAGAYGPGPAFDHTSERLFADLEAAYRAGRDLLLVAEECGSVVGAAMGFMSPRPEVTLRILAVAPGRRRQGLGRALLRAFEASALRLGVTRLPWGPTPRRASMSFGGMPQLFVDLDERSPVVRAEVQDLVRGAHVGYCMTKVISAPPR